MATRKTTKTTGRPRAKKGARPADRMKDSANKIWLAGLGAFAMAEEEGGKVFRGLVEKGKEFEKVGREQLDRARDRVGDFAKEARERFEEVADEAKDRAGETWGKVEKHWDERTSKTLKRLGVPTRDEIARLTRRIEELTALVEEKAASARKRTTGRRPAAKRSAGSRSAARKKAG